MQAKLIDKKTIELKPDAKSTVVRPVNDEDKVNYPELFKSKPRKVSGEFKDNTGHSTE